MVNIHSAHEQSCAAQDSEACTSQISNRDDKQCHKVRVDAVTLIAHPDDQWAAQNNQVTTLQNLSHWSQYSNTRSFDMLLTNIYLAGLVAVPAMQASTEPKGPDIEYCTSNSYKADCYTEKFQSHQCIALIDPIRTGDRGSMFRVSEPGPISSENTS